MVAAGTTAPDAATGLPEAEAYQLPGTRLFGSGLYRGRRWTPDDIREMARNARLLGPDGLKLYVPSCVPGHEDGDAWKEHLDLDDRTDLPAAGWVDPSTVEAVPDPDEPGEMILRGTIVNVPPEMAKKIYSHEYRTGSSEIYDSFEDDLGRPYGKVLRRFSFLGAEPPQVKRLGPLPRPCPMPALRQFSERAGVIVRERRVRRGDVVHTYAETTVMDRNQITAAIQAAMPKLSKATLDAMSDDSLMDLLNSLPGQDQAAAAAAAPAAPAAMAEGDPAGGDGVAGPSREELVAEVKAAIPDLSDDEVAAMSDDELQAMLDEIDAQADAGGGESPASPPPAAPMAEGDPAAAGAPAPADAGLPDRDQMIAELTAAGQDAAALDAMPDADLAALYQQVVGAAAAGPPAATQMSGKPRMGADGYAVDVPEVAKLKNQVKYHSDGRTGMTRCSEGRPVAPAAVTARAARVQRTWDQIERMSERTRARLARNEVRRKRQEAEKFCESLVREGRATPAQVKAAYLPLLLQLDDTNPVHKFSENGRTTRLTAFERKCRELARLPQAFQFGERLGGGRVPETSTEGEAQKVREFAATLPDAAIKGGQYRDREHFVEKFCETAKKRPGLTAAQYLGLAERY